MSTKTYIQSHKCKIAKIETKIAIKVMKFILQIGVDLLKNTLLRLAVFFKWDHQSFYNFKLFFENFWSLSEILIKCRS